MRLFYLKHGDPDIIQIRKTFNSKEKAINYERTLLKKIKAATHPHYLNKCDYTFFPKKYISLFEKRYQEKVRKLEKRKEAFLEKEKKRKKKKYWELVNPN